MSSGYLAGLENRQPLSLRQTDPELWSLVARERQRQAATLSLVASESFALPSALRLQGSHLSQKLIEGYVGGDRRTGSEPADAIERLAVARARALFGAEHANVQAYSGSIANLAALRALVRPGGRILAMHPTVGGHHTLGGSSHITGSLYEVHHAAVDRATGVLDYDAISRQAVEVRPDVLAVGSSFYPRIIDFARLVDIARSVEARLLADIAHIAGLVVAGLHPNPATLADIVTSSTHKTLTGPRGGGLILSKQMYADAVDAAVFPFLQGAPVLNVIAARAALFKAVATDSFRELMRRVVRNARSLAAALKERRIPVVSGGTDTHLLIIDLKNTGLDSAEAQQRLERIGITTGKVPLPEETHQTRGLRLGTVCITQRGMGSEEMDTLADTIAAALADSRAMHRLRGRVRDLARSFPPDVGY